MVEVQKQIPLCKSFSSRVVKMFVLNTPQKHPEPYNFEFTICQSCFSDVRLSEKRLSSRNSFGCGKAISLMWGLNSAPLVSHASLQTARPSKPSKVLLAMRLWAQNFIKNFTKQDFLFFLCAANIHEEKFIYLLLGQESH